MKRETSFAQKLKAGWSQEQLEKYYVLAAGQYDRIIACLKVLHEKDGGI